MTVILVTGASGFVGGHLTRALVQRGHQVRCTVRKTSRTAALEQLGVQLATVDLLEPDSLLSAVSGVDIVFHAAACLSAFRFSTMLRVNGHGTAHLANACGRQPNPPVLVLVSSVAAAGPARRGSLRREQDFPRPISHYGRSKRAAEVAAESLADRVPTTIVRPGIVYGPGDADSLLPVCRMIDRWGLHVVPGCQSPPLSLIHVSELVEVLLRAAERGTRLPGTREPSRSGVGYYFAVVPEYPTYFQFGRMLHRALERTRRTRYWHVPLPYPYLVATMAELLARLRIAPDRLNIDKIRDATAESWACSGAAAARDLGFQPHAPLQDQLGDTIRWYREQGWL